MASKPIAITKSYQKASLQMYICVYIYTNIYKYIFVFAKLEIRLTLNNFTQDSDRFLKN